LALERILEAAGLTEGREYILQGRGLGLKSDTGGIQRPDVVVNLPERRTMIIDSKGRVRRTKVALADANKGFPEPATLGSVVVWSSSLGACCGFRRAAPWHCGFRLAPPTAVQGRAKR